MASQVELDIGQLMWVGFEGTSAPPELVARITAGQVGMAVLFARNLAKQNDLIDIDAVTALNAELRQAAPDGMRCLTAVDQEGGVVQRLRAPVTKWPPMLSLDQHDGGRDTQLAFETGYAIGKELRATGFDVDFAPVLDVHTNPANPIIGDRSFGTTAEAVARRALAFARGLSNAGVIGCGKHFPGHGDTSTDSHLELPRVDHDWQRLNAVELAPFAAAIKAHLPMLMTAHVVFSALDPTVPATLSPKVMTDLLRNTMGYQGVVVSDDLDMKAIASHFGIGAAAVGAIEAGCDAILLCRDRDHQTQAYQALVDRAAASPTFTAKLAQAADRVRALKRNHVQMQQNIPPDRRCIGSVTHERLALRIAKREA